MKLSKEYITIRLAGNTTVRELAEEITDSLHSKYQKDGTIDKYNEAGLSVDRAATVAKFERMLQPYAPKVEA